MNAEATGYDWTSCSTTTLLCVVVALLLYVTSRRRTGIPPGPARWPIIGGMGAFYGKDTFTAFKCLRKKYGDIFSVYIGSELTIVLNGYQAINEAFVMKGRVFSRRPVTRFSQLMLKDVCLVFENGVKWKRHRQFALAALHELCFSSNGTTLEDRIREELSHFTKKLEDFTGPVDCNDIITLSFSNVMYNVIHGRRAGYENEKFRWYVKFQESEQKIFCRNQLMHYCFPFLILLPGDVLNTKRAVRFSAKLKEYFDEVCAENFATYKDGDRKCLIDLWLSAANDSPCLKKENLWKVINELMAAGSETTATTFKWILLCLAKHPKIQTALRNDIFEKFGDETVTLAHKHHLPLASAIIYETLRFGNVVPLGIPHSVSQDVMFNGHLIPKNTTILSNIASVNLDPEIFPEPLEFKPERFLSADGQTLLKSKKLIPFSVGPRSCLGETIAQSELFLYLTTLIQKFEICEAKSDPLPSLVGAFGLTNRPQSYKILIHKL